MALPDPLRRRRLTPPLLALLLLAQTGVRAQVADVARPDGRGDFRTIRITGARGSVAQRFWLVVDHDPGGLLCRDERGRAWIALRYGSIVELDAPERQVAPRLIAGKPYLRLTVRPIAMLQDARGRERGTPATCWVRANSAFLAPIQADALERTGITP